MLEFISTLAGYSLSPPQRSSQPFQPGIILLEAQDDDALTPYRSLSVSDAADDSSSEGAGSGSVRSRFRLLSVAFFALKHRSIYLRALAAPLFSTSLHLPRPAASSLSTRRLPRQATGLERCPPRMRPPPPRPPSYEGQDAQSQYGSDNLRIVSRAHAPEHGQEHGRFHHKGARAPPVPSPSFRLPLPAVALPPSLPRALACLLVDTCAAFLRPFSLLLFPLASPATRPSISPMDGTIPALHYPSLCLASPSSPPPDSLPLPSLARSGLLAVLAFRVLRGSAFRFRFLNSTASSDSDHEHQHLIVGSGSGERGTRSSS
ncbi:hypothetical protein FB451DRAFT_1568774 [Mycena latifolia]|nr:hypothetical protein FB451DRAFT_1568774 [Mycena latifolia]